MGSPEDMLIYMIYHQDVGTVRSLLKAKVNINFQHNEGVTPLLAATETGNYEMTKLLLEHGANCNMRERLANMNYPMSTSQKQNNALTPLVNAAMHGYSDIVQLLIEHGADINFRDASGRSALPMAIQQDKRKCAEILTRNGANVPPMDIAEALKSCSIPNLEMLRKENIVLKNNENKNLNVPNLHLAALDGDREQLRDLIEKGADINLQDKFGNTALHIVLENGYLGCAELLIKKGADVNIHRKNKNTVLHVAASLGITKIIPLLIEEGAIVDARGFEEVTPLHLAIFNAFPMCVKQLIDFGANVNTTFADRKTALHLAVIKFPDCIEMLLKENADIYAKDDTGLSPIQLAIELGIDTYKKMFPEKNNKASVDGTTPLHVAARCVKIDCLRLMIQDGCDVNVTNNRGDTPLHFACIGNGIVSSIIHESSESEKLNVALLIRAGAEINKKNNTGLTPLHMSAMCGFVSSLKTLCRLGAEINLPGGEKKQTPLHYAAENGSLICIKYLIEHGADIRAVNSENCTSLMLAAKNAHISSVKYLLENNAPLWIS